MKVCIIHYKSLKLLLKYLVFYIHKCIYTIPKYMNNECRVCLDTYSSQNMLSSCNCSGTIAYIHKECLIQSILINKEEFCKIFDQ